MWSDWSTQPKVELSHGIRFDTTYYYWPPEWVLDRPGLFTGSGMPMRFADFDGTLIDVYQATTQMTDESEQTYPYTIDTLLDGALGSEGYYGAFTANMHTDSEFSDGSDAIVASAQARGVPIVSARQMLQWWDGRNASSFSNLTWNGSTLSFTITQASDANGLQAMLPFNWSDASLASITRDGSPVSYTAQPIKGIEYAFFTATTGSYSASYVSGKTNQTITFNPLPNKTYGEPPFTVVATATSSLPVTFTVSGTCIITDTTVTVTGGGSCTVTAHQAGDANYNAAPDVPQTFSIAKANQTITFNPNPLPNKTYGDPPFTVVATATSSLPVTFTVSGTCTHHWYHGDADRSGQLHGDGASGG